MKGHHMTNDLPILSTVDERADKERRTITYPVDLCRHLRSMHWSAASATYMANMPMFQMLADDMDYSQRGMRLRDKLASLN
ncbi:MAG TPA: hypothetical protein P5291_02315 [Flavobacteriales bacterium]|nr:hypothetical protein [Flavobacteriales bacterium]